MIVKPSFELIYGKTSKIYNVFPINSKQLDEFKISNEDFFHLKILCTSFARTQSSGDIVLDNINDIIAVRVPSYPLPGFITKDGKGVINLSVLSSEYISDYSSADVYSLFLYVISLKLFITNTPFEKEIENHVTNFIISKFMGLFGKKYGLLGSHKGLIPYMQVIIALYVHTAMMGNELNKEEISKISSRYLVDANELKMLNEINTTIGFLKILKYNNIIPISENKFSTTIINIAGVSALPLFEDISRFFATILASSVPGNSIFSRFWGKGNRKLYEKIIEIGNINLKRANRFK